MKKNALKRRFCGDCAHFAACGGVIAEPEDRADRCRGFDRAAKKYRRRSAKARVSYILDKVT